MEGRGGEGCSTAHCMSGELNTVVQEIFMCGNFHGKHFCAEIFSLCGPTTKIFYQRNVIHVSLRKWRIMKELYAFVAFTCIATCDTTVESFSPHAAVCVTVRHYFRGYKYFVWEIFVV